MTLMQEWLDEQDMPQRIASTMLLFESELINEREARRFLGIDPVLTVTEEEE